MTRRQPQMSNASRQSAERASTLQTPARRHFLIEGEPAQLLLSAVFALQVSASSDGRRRLAGKGDPAAMAALRRAMSRLEARLEAYDSAHGGFAPTEASSRRRMCEAFDIVAKRAMDAYGIEQAPWELQLAS
ncbi:hypothetical protein [Naasia lichenicola]|uniref:Uncharacterized protein n=1 Tax=Naasia lichenicola TaxID=2565933 RepID=A0A4S4FSS1_9MICO|nr:hypothetical protein [Naasia lichenicola]THG33358.1 hypothetical protein E6C64_03125 [Naasia lichenicola]